MSDVLDRDLDVLGDLKACSRTCPDREWYRPLDCGGSNGSDHSYRLAKLAKAGLADRKQRSSWFRGRRGSWVYRITPAGIRALAAETGGRT